MKLTTLLPAALLAALTLTAHAADQPGAMPDQPVTQEHLAPGAYQAFTAPLEATVTLDALQEQASPPTSYDPELAHYFHSNIYNQEQGGFEPMALRPKYRAEATSMDVVELKDNLAQNVREGLYDGARVRVYQAIDGKLVKIRDTQVKPGGHHASGWLDTRWQITTVKGKTDFKLALDSSFQPNREYWFSVKAVDKFGQFSEPSNVVSLKTGEAKGQNSPESGAPLQRFETDNPDKSVPPPAPKNLRATVEGDVVRFEWDPIESEHLRGYKILVSSVPPDQQKGYRLALADRQPRPDRPIQRGDIVFVDHPGLTTFTPDILSPYVNWPALRQMPKPFNSWLLGNYRFWSDGSDYPAKWELVKHPAPVLADFVAPGKTCLKWEVAGDELTGIMLAPTGGISRKNSYYTPLTPGEYAVEVWLRGSGKAAIAFTGPHANPGTPLPFKQVAPAANPHAIAPVDLPISDQWKKVTGSFTVESVPESGMGHILFTFQGPGTVYMDDLRIYRKETVPYGVLQEPYLGHLRDSSARFLRYHDPIRSKLGHTLDEMTLPAGGSAMGSTGLKARPTTFQSLLDTTRLAGSSPRMQVEMCLSDDEWLGLAEWLFAPYDPAQGDTPEKKPWASRRWLQGQKKPWIEEFPELALEISNETWNQSFEPYDWDWGNYVLVDGANGQTYSYGATYGLFQQHVIDLIKSSPYWNDTIAKKTRFPLGGWMVAQSFGADAARLSPDSGAIGYACYLSQHGLGDRKTVTDFKRFYMMQWALSGVDGQARQCMETQKKLRSEGVEVNNELYEYGVLYTAPAPPDINEAENQFGRSLPAGVAVLDASLKALSLGFQDLGYFTFAPSLGFYSSLALTHFGGHPNPFVKALMLYNRYGAGQLLKVETTKVPVWDFPSYETLDNTTKVKRNALPQAPLVSTYASVAGDRVTVFLISRKLDNFPVTGDDGFTPATVKLPFTKAKTLTLHKLVSDPRVDDRFEEHTKLETITLDPKAFTGALAVNAQTGADAKGLPPASIFCYVFEGTDVAKPSLPPVARFEIPALIVAGEPATLRGTAGDGVTYAWDLGPVGKSAEQNPAVTFPEAMMTDLSLTVANPQGLSDTLTRKRYPVGVRFGQEVWRPWVCDGWPKNSGGKGKLQADGKLLVSGANPVVARGRFSILRTEPRFQKDFAIEAVIDGVEGPAKDPRTLAGLALVSNRRTGLGFGELDFEALDTNASLLISPDGAVRKLKGKADQLEELLPAGAVTFPAKVRLVVKANQAVAAVEIAGVWKDVTTFTLPDDIGLMPAFAVGSPNLNPTTMTLSSVVVK